MPALILGTKAPEFELNTTAGTRFSLADELSRSPVILAFFKVSCPTCQYAFPFLERLHRAYGRKDVPLVGISQNDAKETAPFTKQFGVTFPMLLDEPHIYPVSNLYGITDVPTVFWIAHDGEIEISSVGWVKADFETLNRKMAEAGNIP